MQPNSSVVQPVLRVADVLSPDTLVAMASGDLDVIWHRGFFSPKLCATALPKITAACNAASYTMTDDLQSLGTSIGEAAESTANERRYFQTAPVTTRLIREDLFGSTGSPLDRLRVTLDECWPRGANVARVPPAYGPGHMLPGIVRRWPRGGQANPHIDQTSNGPLAHLDLAKRFGMNVYLEVPNPGSGGEIEFWDRVADSDYAGMKRSDYGVDRESLGRPSQALLPAQGDLILFDAAIMHAVAEVADGARVTAACFAGLVSVDEPLALFA